MDLLDTLLAHNKGTTKRLIEQSAPLTEIQLNEYIELSLGNVRSAAMRMAKIDWAPNPTRPNEMSDRE